MTNTNKIIALAKLDGWTGIVSEDIGICGWPNGKKIGPLGCGLALVKDYLTSYDAIIPLVQKQDENIRCETYKKACENRGLSSSGFKIADWWKVTPAEITDALLKAKGLI